MDRSALLLGEQRPADRGLGLRPTLSRAPRVEGPADGRGGHV